MFCLFSLFTYMIYWWRIIEISGLGIIDTFWMDVFLIYLLDTHNKNAACNILLINYLEQFLDSNLFNFMNYVLWSYDIRDKARFIQGDFWFENGYCKHNKTMVEIWAKKEKGNLMRFAFVLTSFSSTKMLVKILWGCNWFAHFHLRYSSLTR